MIYLYNNGNKIYVLIMTRISFLINGNYIAKRNSPNVQMLILCYRFPGAEIIKISALARYRPVD